MDQILDKFGNLVRIVFFSYLPSPKLSISVHNDNFDICQFDDNNFSTLTTVSLLLPMFWHFSTDKKIIQDRPMGFWEAFTALLTNFVVCCLLICEIYSSSLSAGGANLNKPIVWFPSRQYHLHLLLGQRYQAKFFEG